jgi:hypothetical protein
MAPKKKEDDDDVSSVEMDDDAEEPEEVRPAAHNQIMRSSRELAGHVLPAWTPLPGD